MIIIEGIDGTGKSTLAQLIAHGRNIQESEGPAKSVPEIAGRIRRYYDLVNTIFVRHPVVSQTMYNHVRTGGVIIPDDVTSDFYSYQHLFIYCDPGNKRHEHVVKPGEDPAFIRQIESNYNSLLWNYRLWAVNRAHLIYRIGDDVGMISSFVEDYISKRPK